MGEFPYSVISDEAASSASLGVAGAEALAVGGWRGRCNRIVPQMFIETVLEVPKQGCDLVPLPPVTGRRDGTSAESVLRLVDWLSPKIGRVDSNAARRPAEH